MKHDCVIVVATDADAACWSNLGERCAVNALRWSCLCVLLELLLFFLVVVDVVVVVVICDDEGQS